MIPPVIKGPFLPRKASRTLRDQLVNYLTERRLAAGESFFSDTGLMRLSGLSRTTVRKALDLMAQEGWIERQPGKGSFVGRRSAVTPRPVTTPTGRVVVRMAVLAYCMQGDAPNWYAHGVLQGLDEVAAEQAISIELLGSYTQDMRVLTQRLTQSGPDVLAVMPATSRHAFLIGEAQRLGIPTILTGTRMVDLQIPSVAEDSVQGAALAVKHLVEKGHRRIGLLQRCDADLWVFYRREGYVQGLRESGIELDERLVLWDPIQPNRPSHELLYEYLQEQKPTALVLSSESHVIAVGELVRAGRLRIPQDLSVVSFDQHYSSYKEHLGFCPTIIELPLKGMGQQLAYMARSLKDGGASAMRTLLPCRLVEGESVRDIRV